MIPCIWTLYGPSGSGKSSQAMLFPGPISYHDLEHGARRAWGWNKAIESGQVVLQELQLPVKSMTRRFQKLDGWVDTWRDLSDQVEAEFSDDKIPSIAIDTGTVAWEIDRDAFLEQVQAEHPLRKQLIRIEYGEPNRRMTFFYDRPHVTNTHLILIHHETDHYVPLLDSAGRPILDEENKPASAPDGTKVPDGFKKATEKSDWVLYFEHKVAGKPTVTIKKSAYGFDLIDLVIDWDEIEKWGGIYNVLDNRLQVLGRV